MKLVTIYFLENKQMKKTIKALLVILAIISGGIAKSDPFGTGCQTIYDFNTGTYTKICCNAGGKCTVITF